MDISKALAAQRVRAQRLLPEKALTTEASVLLPFEVVLAYNLEHPYRYCQDYWWLEVMAEDKAEARSAASKWITDSEDSRFESTGWVRKLTDHWSTAIGGGNILPINWRTPVPQENPAGMAIRDPVDGRRAGYLADREKEMEVLSLMANNFQSGFRLLLARPVGSASPVALAPEVE